MDDESGQQVHIEAVNVDLNQQLWKLLAASGTTQS